VEHGNSLSPYRDSAGGDLDPASLRKKYALALTRIQKIDVYKIVYEPSSKNWIIHKPNQNLKAAGSFLEAAESLYKQWLEHMEASAQSLRKQLISSGIVDESKIKEPNFYIDKPNVDLEKWSLEIVDYVQKMIGPRRWRIERSMDRFEYGYEAKRGDTGYSLLYHDRVVKKGEAIAALLELAQEDEKARKEQEESMLKRAREMGLISRSSNKKSLKFWMKRLRHAGPALLSIGAVSLPPIIGVIDGNSALAILGSVPLFILFCHLAFEGD